MSYKYQARSDGEGAFRLEKCGSMHCDVVAFFNQELYDRSEEDVWRQAVWCAERPGVTHVFLMPDAHTGFGVPIGGVVLSDDTIIQAGSGYDISCGVAILRLSGVKAEDVADPEKRRCWMNAVLDRVALGLGDQRPEKMKSVSSFVLKEILLHGVEALHAQPEAYERTSLPVNSKVFDHSRVPGAFDKAALQLGSLGSGNHFLDLLVDPKDSSVWVMLHCGSRKYGHSTAEYFYYAGAELRGLPRNRREESYLSLEEGLGRAYWDHHNSAANYAIANRHVIAQAVQDATEETLGSTAELYYDISHNLIQEEEVYLPDGSLVEKFVHRKGATRAFPAGHPDLDGHWSETGHPCLIPGSMQTGVAILFPTKEGPHKSGCSVNHGSGRSMGRGAAKRLYGEDQDFIDEEMQTAELECDDGTVIEGILINGENTPLDECGRAYKDLDEVLSVLVDAEIATIARRLYPVAVLMSMKTGRK